MLREFEELAAQGVEVVLCPLLRERESVVHPAALPWVERAWYTPFASPRLARDALALVGRTPRAAWSAWAEPLAGVARTPNFLVGSLGILLKASHLARRMAAEGIDHVHAHFATHPTMAALMIHRLSGIPYSFTAHAHDIYVHTAMLREKMAAARFVVTISDFNRRRLDQYGDAGKVHVVRYGIDLTRYPLREERPADPFTIVSVASLQRYKGLEYLIRACALLEARRSEPFRCLIAGRGELRDDLQGLIGELGLEERVELLGPLPQEDVQRLLRQAHVFVLPSVVEPSGKMEGLPNVLIEALAVGLPVISTEISGIPEIVRPGETGRLVPPGDAETLAEAVGEVMADPGAALRLARNGRRLVEREHSLERNVGRLKTLFEESLERPR